MNWNRHYRAWAASCLIFFAVALLLTVCVGLALLSPKTLALMGAALLVVLFGCVIISAGYAMTAEPSADPDEEPHDP
jgi:hypothetical protein